MPVLAKLQRSSSEDSRQFAYRVLKLSIQGLLLFPGAKLSEAELAGSLCMSRTPVRDVLARLGREKLVELIPNRGAFVALISRKRAEGAAWVQLETGIAMMDVLYIENVKAKTFAGLQQNLARQQLLIATEDFVGAVCTAFDFYRELYVLANLEQVWNSIQYTGADFRRVAQLCGSNRSGCESAWAECRNVLDALCARDNAAACHELRCSFGRVCARLPSLPEEYPTYFGAN